MKCRFILPLMIVVFIVAACTPAPDIRNDAFLNDTSLISGEPCAAPCWQNLIPGETAWGVAQDFVTENPDFSQIESESDRRTGEAWVEFAYQDGPKCCRIYSADGEILTSILLLVSPQMTVSDVIANYGDPTYLSAQAETSDQAYVPLVYPDVAMIVYAFAENITDSEINEDNEIVGLVYMSQSEMENLLTTQNLYNWDGYGVLGDIIDGQFDVTPLPETENEDTE